MSYHDLIAVSNLLFLDPVVKPWDDRSEIDPGGNDIECF
ncbi:palindromic element RPE4 domain-containing protein [Rickettsia asembonensis]|nr:palindromic element RPE4 domain-containing protein [Rickettsia asembonensis]